MLGCGAAPEERSDPMPIGRELAERFFEEMCNQRRLDIAKELLTSDHVYHDPNVPSEPGPEGMAQVVKIYQDGVEGHWAIQEIVEAGDRVTVRWVGEGTHTGEVMGVAPTGRKIRVDAVSVLHIRDGKIARNYTVWDTLGFLRQIGAVPQ
jgi:steroid delta-isomerase-like uncharacterized protein